MAPDAYTQRAREALTAAVQTATEAGHPEVSPAHLVASLLQAEDGYVAAVLDHIGADRVLHLDTTPVEHASALALAPLVSTLNHSCAPNVAVVNNDPREPRWSLSHGIRVVATENIIPDVELFFEYDFPHLPEDPDERPAPRQRRQRLYEDQYFWCQCPACLDYE